MLEYMSEEEIRLLANKYYEPGKPIDGDWHKIYIDECEKINEKLHLRVLFHRNRIKNSLQTNPSSWDLPSKSQVAWLVFDDFLSGIPIQRAPKGKFTTKAI